MNNAKLSLFIILDPCCNVSADPAGARGFGAAPPLPQASRANHKPGFTCLRSLFRLIGPPGNTLFSTAGHGAFSGLVASDGPRDR